MISDWYANAFFQNKGLIDEISSVPKKEKLGEEQNKKLKTLLEVDPSLAYNVLAVCNKDQANELRQLWIQNNSDVDYAAKLKEWGVYDFFEQTFAADKIDLSLLPRYSFKLCCKFKLKKPYISRGEEDFYIIDNPLTRDMVFRLPCVNPTAWKGNLRSALRQEGHEDDEDGIIRLFGAKSSVNGNDAFSKGSLHFMPTFFWKSSLEIINPHDRKRRVGKNPIMFEAVPAGADGSLVLFYIPFVTGNNDERKEVAADIGLVAKGVSSMLARYGFGAKTSDGFGIADIAPKEDNYIEINAAISDIGAGEVLEEPEECFSKYLDEFGVVKREYLGNGEFGLLSNKEYNSKKDQLGAGSKNEFKRFRNWYKEWGEKWQEHLNKKKIFRKTFSTFGEMENIAIDIGKKLNEEEIENEH